MSGTESGLRFAGRVTYKTNYPSRRSTAHVILYDEGPFTVLIATEIADNGGASITNTSEELATHICAFFNLDRKRFVMVEHYDKESFPGGREHLPEVWDLVSFQEDKNGVFDRPVWRRLQPSELIALGVTRYTQNKER